MRKLYLFVSVSSSRNWLNCFSLTDDGYILGNHICSDISYMVEDLHDRKDRLEKIKTHFKEPYEIETLSYEECKTHTGFLQAIKLANEKTHTYEKAGATITKGV